jgi:hypothetical protein
MSTPAKSRMASVEFFKMRPSRVGWLRVGALALTFGFAAGTSSTQAQNAPETDLAPLVINDPAQNPAATPGDPRLKPMTEGPVHEAFLSKAKDREPAHVPKAPPDPVVERPAVDPPNEKAQWIEGYWDWDLAKGDFVWVTGTWRVAPPGRLWVNSYWKRDEKGWFRVPGFWSDRKTERIDYRKTGPPADRPDENVGESPGADHFYVPGVWVPDGDGVAWRKGFWAKAQTSWSWVPAQWIRQPEGWVFQEGFWDRTLEDRGTLFTPAQVMPTTSGTTGPMVYQPLSQVSPQDYGLLYGAFGRPNSNYDGYPGGYYDN